MIKGLFRTLLLLPLGVFGAPFTQLKTHIALTSDPLVGITALTNIYNSLGYKIEINSISTHNGTSRIEAVVIGLKPLEMAVLADNIQESGMKLTHSRMNQGSMELDIDATEAVWNQEMLGIDEGKELQRSNTPYWFRVEAGQVIRIQPPYGGKWYPDVSVLDKSMRILYTKRSDKEMHELVFPLPAGSYYLKISNTAGMKALKEGMWVESMSEGR